MNRQALGIVLALGCLLAFGGGIVFVLLTRQTPVNPKAPAIAPTPVGPAQPPAPASTAVPAIPAPAVTAPPSGPPAVVAPLPPRGDNEPPATPLLTPPPPPQPLANAPAPAPAPAVTVEPPAVNAGEAPLEDPWKLVDERKFNGRLAWEAYHPYYVIDADPVGREQQEKVIQYHWYPDEADTEYHPDDEVMLNASRVIDRKIRLAKQTPHTLRWEVVFHGGSQVGLTDDGAIVGDRADENDFPITPTDLHTLVLERAGTKLTLQVDGGALHTCTVAADDRAPLSISAQTTRVLLRSTRLSFGHGETLSPPPVTKADVHPLRWVELLHEDFAKPDSIKLLVASPATARLVWNKEDQAVEFGPLARDDTPDHAYVLLHRSLPGDMRVSLRARGMREHQYAFFGLLANVAGSLKKEDGYFMDWNYWQVQIKKKNVRQAGVEVDYGIENPTDWVHCRFEKVAGKLTMFTENKEVLTWTDPHPYITTDHDLFTLYCWHVAMEFDDLVIERNALDPQKPRVDDPAVETNYLGGERPDPNKPAAENQDEF